MHHAQACRMGIAALSAHGSADHQASTSYANPYTCSYSRQPGLAPGLQKLRHGWLSPRPMMRPATWARSAGSSSGSSSGRSSSGSNAGWHQTHTSSGQPDSKQAGSELPDAADASSAASSSNGAASSNSSAASGAAAHSELQPAPSDAVDTSDAASRERSQSPAAGSTSMASVDGSPRWSPKLVAMILLVLVFGVTNRVLYKQALVPMQNYVFFLAQFQNIGYLAVYFTALWVRYRRGLVTPDMLKMDKKGLLAVGACEAIAQLLFMIGAAHLPGPLLPVINQSYLVWNLMFARLVLRTRFTKTQLTGAALIMLGVVFAAVPPHALAGLLNQVFGVKVAATAVLGAAPKIEPLYVGICVLCFAFPALASVIKDVIFRRERARLGYPLDIFMVNSFGSLYQAGFVLLLLPVTTALYGMSLPELPQYLAEGARCFRGLAPACGSSCAGAPGLPVAYVLLNLAFNVAMLRLLRSVGTVTTTIVGSCLVPLTILAFTLPLPFLEPAVMSANFVAGVIVLLVGLLVYNYHAFVKPLVRKFVGSHHAQDSVDLPPHDLTGDCGGGSQVQLAAT
eukprot:CAMPEP_0202860260 /NCGR_PEP_ID=MMETSP1391-20130828/2039_1 /ASSEMBLY_ACC=CAM_ASM_000867 /TAXON_ID=1034604 /ORGANISM="Chlamydomonas leiostraca, Strain SAG 11-49" /LENGTH=566 /DNA_ID=CAMNT_0049539403 /DNA_START=243 /DNA_END=1944 /DNA_ORIENTATION=-